MSLEWAESPKSAVFSVFLKKNGVEVAKAVDDRGLPVYSWQNNSATLIYREKVDVNAEYKLCHSVSNDLKGRKILPGWYQYGYKIFGPGHNFIN